MSEWLDIMLAEIARKHEGLFETKEQQEFWRGVSTAPSDVFGSLRHRFRELNRRLEKMEAHVTSREFEIDRELGS